MLLIRFAQFDAERVLGRGFDLCKEGTRGRPTRVLLTLQGAELSTLSLQQLIQFAHRDVLTKHVRVAAIGEIALFRTNRERRRRSTERCFTIAATFRKGGGT